MNEQPRDVSEAAEDQDLVSYEELATGEAAQSAALDNVSYSGDNDEVPVPLLDPLLAYAQEDQRMRRAGPRRRVTADDLDRRAP